MNAPNATRARASRFAFLSAIPLVAWIVIALSTLGVVGGVAVAVNASGAEPAVGLYWQTNTDPTAGAGVAAPLWQLLWRTDAPSVYFKSGSANTAWTKVGSGTTSGGTVTSITFNGGLTSTPDPITTSGTASLAQIANQTLLGNTSGGLATPAALSAAQATAILNDFTTTLKGLVPPPGTSTGTKFLEDNGTWAIPPGTIGGGGTTGDLTMWASATTLGNYAGSTPTPCTTGNVVTGSAVDAAGALTQTCTAIGAAGGVTGTGTSGTSARFTGPTSVGNGSWADTGSALSTSSTVTLNGQETVANQILQTGIITPTALGTTTNNYNPTGLAGASIIVQSASSAFSFTGLTAQPTGTVITFINPTTSSGAISFSNLNAGSTGANQFRLPNATGWTIDVGMAVTFRYSGSDWQIVNGFFETLPNITVNAIANLNQLRYAGPQTFSTTGSSNNVALNSTTTIFKYTGTSAGTITGFSGTNANRLLIVYNNSANALTLSNLSGSSLSSGQMQNVGNVDVTLPADGSSATYVYDTTTNGPWHMVGLTTTTRADPVSFTNTKNRGTITLSSGTGTATVQSSSICTCTDSTAANVVKCAVATTTLTATGTGTDVISYLCF